MLFVSKPDSRLPADFGPSIEAGRVLQSYWGDAKVARNGAGRAWDVFHEILPSAEAAAAARRELILHARQGAAKYPKMSEEKGGEGKVEQSGLFLLRAELTDDELARRRFAHSWTAGKWECLGPRWGRGIALVLACMRREDRKSVESVFDELMIKDYKSATELSRTLKELTTVAKKHGDAAFPGWKNFINWETLGGYLPTKEIGDFVADLENWATGDVIHEMPRNGAMSEEYFLDTLEQGMDEFFDLAPNVLSAMEAPGIDEWSIEPENWARSGSSTTQAAVWYLTRKGTRAKAKKSKWRAALAMPWQAVARALRETRPGLLRQLNSAIQKRESGKVRAVVNSDDATYLRMAFVSATLERALMGHPQTTLYMNKSQLLDLWKEMGEDVKNDYIKVPLDQDHFDWQQNKRMIARFFSSVKRFIGRVVVGDARTEILSVVDALRVALVDEDGVLKVGDKEILITKGIMSGWRWTALMDTVFNVGELYCARRLIMDAGLDDPVVKFTAQGDDDRVVCASWGGAALLVKAYGWMNFQVNPSKFFMDTRRDEFLRQVAQDGDVSGYLVRGVLSLLWRNPVSRDPVAGILRLGEQVVGWNTIAGRGGDHSAVLRLMLRDMSGANGISKADVLRVLHTPSSVGGAGLFSPVNNEGLAMEIGRVDVHTKLELDSIQGLQGEVRQWKDLGVIVGNDVITDVAKGVLELTLAKKDVTPGKLKEVTIPSRARFGSGFGSGMPMAARWRKELPRTTLQSVVREAVHQRNWEWIRWAIDPDMATFARRIEVHGGRAVWLDWITGNLPFHSPSVFGWSALCGAVVGEGINESAWSDVSLRPRFTRSTVERYAVSAEEEARSMVQRGLIHIGG